MMETEEGLVLYDDIEELEVEEIIREEEQFDEVVTRIVIDESYFTEVPDNPNGLAGQGEFINDKLNQLREDLSKELEPENSGSGEGDESEVDPTHKYNSGKDNKEAGSEKHKVRIKKRFN